MCLESQRIGRYLGEYNGYPKTLLSWTKVAIPSSICLLAEVAGEGLMIESICDDVCDISDLMGLRGVVCKPG